MVNSYDKYGREENVKYLRERYIRGQKKRENCGSHPCGDHAGTTMVVVSVTCGARGNTTSLTERAVVG